MIWLQDASCAALPGTTASGMADWADANAAAAALADGTCGLTDGSQAGDWRLPEIGEFCSEDDPTPTIGVCPTGNAVNSLVNTNFGSPALSNAAGVATWDTDGDAFVGVLSNLYWSVTENDATRAWYAHLNDGSVTNTTKVTFLYVWPVRSGSNLLGLASRVDLETHESDADAHREHASLEESAEIDADVAAHAALPGAHHAPTVNTDTLAGLSCADGQIAKWSGSLAQWECGQDQRADTALSFTMSSYSVNEAVGAASISVQRTGDSGGAVSARCDTADGTATAGSDYTATMDTLNWADGDTAVKQCTVPITDDSAEESSQTVNLSLSNVTGGASIGTPASAVLTIEDNDTLLELSFTLSAYAVDEDVGTASIPVQKTGNAPGAVSVQCSTSDGTATAPGDYTATMDTLSWADGESGTKNCTIPIVIDVMVETDETINLTLTNVVGPASIGTPSSAVLTINSNST